MVNRIVQGTQPKRVVREMLGIGMHSGQAILVYIVRCQPLRSSPGLTKHYCSALPVPFEIRRRKTKHQLTHEAHTSVQARTSGFILETTAAKIGRETKREIKKYFIFHSLRQSRLKTTR